jgi:hypothetical protein
MNLVRITAPHFVAGLEVGGQVAPILHYMRTWPIGQIVAYCKQKRWHCEEYLIPGWLHHC